MNMIKWLKVHLDHNDIPGLRWITLNESFRVDWVHCGSQDWSQERLQVFIEYAIHRGTTKRLDIETYKKEDIEKYKRNFRSALGKYKRQNIIDGPKKVRDNDDPHNEYRFVLKSKKKKSAVIPAKEKPCSDHISDKEIPCWKDLELSSLESATSDGQSSYTAGEPNETVITNGDDSICTSWVSRDSTNVEAEMGTSLLHSEHSPLQQYNETISQTVPTVTSHSLTDTISSVNGTSHFTEARVSEQNGLDVLRSIAQFINMTPGNNGTTSNDTNTVLPTQCYTTTNNTNNEIIGSDIQEKRHVPVMSLSQAIPDVVQSVDSHKQQDTSRSDSSLEFLLTDIFQQSGLSSSDMDEILNKTICAVDPSSSGIRPIPEICHLQCAWQNIKQIPVQKVVSLSQSHECSNKGIMNIDIYARNHLVSSHHIENPNGCMIFNHSQVYDRMSESEVNIAFGRGHRDRQKIYLDSWKISLDTLLLSEEEKARQRAQNILQNITRPVVLFCVNGDIKIERYCIATVQSITNGDNCKWIKRFDQAKAPVTLFSGSNYFKPSLTLFEKNESAMEPSTAVVLVIGQNCKNYKEEFPKALLVVRVTSCEAQRKLDMVKEERARSLSLAYSQPNSVDELIEQTQGMSL